MKTINVNMDSRSLSKYKQEQLAKKQSDFSK